MSPKLLIGGALVAGAAWFFSPSQRAQRFATAMGGQVVRGLNGIYVVKNTGQAANQFGGGGLLIWYPDGRTLGNSPAEIAENNYLVSKFFIPA